MVWLLLEDTGDVCRVDSGEAVLHRSGAGVSPFALRGSEDAEDERAGSILDKSAFLSFCLPLGLSLPRFTSAVTHVGSRDESSLTSGETEVVGGSAEELSGAGSGVPFARGALEAHVCELSFVACESKSAATSTSVKVMMSLWERPSKASSSVVEPMDVSTAVEPTALVVSTGDVSAGMMAVSLSGIMRDWSGE